MPNLRASSPLCALVMVIAALPASAGGAASSSPSPYAAVAAEVRATLDPQVDPCQDFYRYACGGWLAKTPLPPDKPGFARSFTQIADRNREALRAILEDAAKNPGADLDRRKLGAFYASCMDEAAIEKAGVTPLAASFAVIDGVKDLPTLMAAAGALRHDGIEALLSTSVEGDFKNPGLYIAYLTQGGLGLLDRDYYLKDDEQSAALREEYQAHVGRMLVLAGENDGDATRHAAAILAFETELAKVSLPRADLADPAKTYNRVDPAGLSAISALPWAPFFAGLGRADLSDLSAAPVGYFQGMAAAVGKTDFETLRAYLRSLALSKQADRLGKAFVDENFAFFGKRLQGQQELEARWKRCVAATDRALGFALGRAFVEKEFPGDSKKIAVEMIEDVEHAFEAGLPQLAWMDDATRARAREKARAVVNKIGYPDVWRDYTALEIVPGEHARNAAAAARFETDRLTQRVGKPVDKRDWVMTPPTVNAYYEPLRNEMVFPAGVLQAPLFNRGFPGPMNYGGIGMAMGHELTHGFDDQGRQFDKDGKLVEWWNPDAVSRFKERARCVSDLYSGFTALPGVSVNGELTLGENIADLGGIKATFRGYRAWAERNGKPGPYVPGFTNDQLLFLGFAQSWCAVFAPQYLAMLLTLDFHSPPNFRVNGPLLSFPAFAEAFQCKPGTPMNPVKRCEVW